MRILAIFAVGSLLFGAAALAIGFACWDEDALIQGGAAFAMAFVPALLTMGLVMSSYRSAPEMRLMAGLGSSGVRMGIAVGGAFALATALPDRFGTAFWYWLVLFYLTLLAFEITLLVWNQPKADEPNKIRQIT